MLRLNKFVVIGAIFLATFARATGASAATIDLAAPVAPFISAGVGDSRSVVLRDDVTFTLTSFGVRMDPLIGIFSLTAELFAYNLNTSTRGALLASGTTAFTDLGLRFYDVALAGALLAGQAYKLNLRPFDTVNFDMEFYFFDNQDGAAGGYIAGPFTVVDGAGDGNVQGRANGAIAHFEVNGTPAAVPEPMSLLLVGTGLAAAGWRKRTRR